MKKILSVILVLIIGATLLPFSALAKETETFTLNVSGKTEGYKAGDVITVTITASNPNILYGLMATPEYDSTAFDMAVENGDVFSDLSTGKNLIFVELNSTPGTTVATLKFTVKEGAAQKDYSFGLKNITASDESENPVSCTIVETTVRVGVYGDVTGDGACKINDITQLMKYLLGNRSAAKYPDVNGDGVENIRDIVCLLKYLVSKH